MPERATGRAPDRPWSLRAPAAADPSQGCADGPQGPRPRSQGPSGARTWVVDGIDRQDRVARGPHTFGATGAPPGGTRRSGWPPRPPGRHRGSPRALPDTAAPRHSAPPTWLGACNGSGGASVTPQAEPCHPSAGADVSRIRRNHTTVRAGGRIRTDDLPITSRLRYRTAPRRRGSQHRTPRGVVLSCAGTLGLTTPARRSRSRSTRA